MISSWVRNPFWGSEKVSVCVHNQLHSVWCLQRGDYWFQARLERARTLLTNRTNQSNPCKRLQKAGGLDSRQKNSVISIVAKRHDSFLSQRHLSPGGVLFAFLCDQVLRPRPLVSSNLRNTSLRCYFGLLPSPPPLFLFLIKSGFFSTTATRVGLLEGNNRMTDCLFQIIGSTVPQAVGYDKNIPPRESNFTNSLDRDTELCLPGRQDCLKIRVKFPTLFSITILNTTKNAHWPKCRCVTLEVGCGLLSLDTKRCLDRTYSWSCVPDRPTRGEMWLTAKAGWFRPPPLALDVLEMFAHPKVLAASSQVAMGVMVSFPLIRDGFKSRLCQRGRLRAPAMAVSPHRAWLTRGRTQPKPLLIWMEGNLRQSHPPNQPSAALILAGGEL